MTFKNAILKIFNTKIQGTSDTKCMGKNIYTYADIKKK